MKRSRQELPLEESVIIVVKWDTAGINVKNEWIRVFKCQTTFTNLKDYHHPKNCKKIKPNSGLKKRPIVNAEIFNTSQKQKQGEPGSFNKKRIFQGSAATAWTPSQGGVIQNKHSGEWELLGPLQKKFTVKAANFNDSNSEDEDEGELLNPSNRNI